MESNWRYLVAEMGMSSSDWELCAWQDTLPLVFLLVKKTGNIAQAYTTSVLTPEGLPTPVGPAIPMPPGEHFPWGFQVLPD